MPPKMARYRLKRLAADAQDDEENDTPAVVTNPNLGEIPAGLRQAEAKRLQGRQEERSTSEQVRSRGTQNAEEGLAEGDAAIKRMLERKRKERENRR